MHTSTLTIRRTDMSNCKEELIKLRMRFDRHMDEHRMDAQDYNERQLQQDLSQERNIVAIDNLTKAVQPLVDGMTVLAAIHKLGKWLSGFAFIGVAISWYTGFNPFK